MRPPSHASCVAIGASRTGCTGCWTWSSTMIWPGYAARMGRPTWHWSNTPRSTCLCRPDPLRASRTDERRRAGTWATWRRSSAAPHNAFKRFPCIFRVNAKEAIGGDGVTQFGRALSSLNIDIICANTPQAKGRIERAFGTLQDRLVKELRLAGVATIEAANDWLPGFIDTYNKRFGQAPANAKNLHRPLTVADDLDEVLAWREVRTVTKNLTLHYDRMMLLLEPSPFVLGLVRKKVEGVSYPDG